MNLSVETTVLRQPEPKDVDALYLYKNDSSVARLLGGFSMGYSKADLTNWIEYHRTCTNEVLWIIADGNDDRCLGHVGLYNIDHRISAAEFAIMLGDKDSWGKGLGTSITKEVVRYGFVWLNLNRIELSVLNTNPRAIHIYSSIGFNQEGIKRQAQYKDGKYIDVQLMAVLRDEFSL